MPDRQCSGVLVLENLTKTAVKHNLSGVLWRCLTGNNLPMPRDIYVHHYITRRPLTAPSDTSPVIDSWDWLTWLVAMATISFSRYRLRWVSVQTGCSSETCIFNWQTCNCELNFCARCRKWIVAPEWDISDHVTKFELLVLKSHIFYQVAYQALTVIRTIMCSLSLI